MSQNASTSASGDAGDAGRSTTPGSGLYRNILPAGPGERNPSAQQHKQRKITAVACQSCQKKRCKCDGRRPQCSACEADRRPDPCVYETRGNQSRSEALKERNQELETEVNRLRERLDPSKTGSPPDAAAPASASALSTPNEEFGRGYSDLPRSAPSSHSTPHDQKPLPSIEPRSRYTGVTELSTRSNPKHAAFSSSMSGGPNSNNDEPGATDREENSSMGKVVFLEAEVYRLRAALEQLGHSADGPAGSESNSSSRRLVVPRHDEESVMSLAQRPLQPQLAISGNGGGMLDSGGRPIDMADTQQFMQHGMSDVGIPGMTREVPANPFETEVFTPYGVFPQSLGNIASPSTLPTSAWASDSAPSHYTYRPGRRRYSLQVMGALPAAFGNLPASSSILANHQHVSVQQSQLNSLRLPLHLIQMLNFDENRPQTYDYASPEFASSTVHSFRAFDRSLIAEGRDPEEVLGEPEIDVRPFFQKGNYDINRHTPSTFGPWFVEAYPSMELPTRIAAAIMVTCLLRWQIHPTLENYLAMPEWLRATGTQMFVPHMSAYDFVPWPEIRDTLIDTPTLPDREVLMWVLSNLHINWPYSNDQIFTWSADGSGASGVNPRFTAQIFDLNNWAINQTVLRRYPSLRGKARFIELEATDPRDI